jgi:hypothetical protein
MVSYEGAIRAVLATTRLHGEGYRKVGAHLAHLCPWNGNPTPDGTITTNRPDVLWRTITTRFYTGQDGWYWFLDEIDHGLDDIGGSHTGEVRRSPGRVGHLPRLIRESRRCATNYR